MKLPATLVAAAFAIFLPLAVPSLAEDKKDDGKEKKEDGEKKKEQKPKVYTGSWTTKSNSIKGTWKIEGNKLKLYSLSTKSAPDLKVFLSPNSLSSLKNSNATSGAVQIAKLAAPKGNQTYTLPKGTDVSNYKTIIIHCEKYSKLWGGSSL